MYNIIKYNLILDFDESWGLNGKQKEKIFNEMFQVRT